MAYRQSATPHHRRPCVWARTPRGTTRAPLGQSAARFKGGQPGRRNPSSPARPHRRSRIASSPDPPPTHCRVPPRAVSAPTDAADRPAPVASAQVVMAPVQQSLDKVQDLMDQFKSDQDDLGFELTMDRHKTRLSRKRERMEAEQHLESARADKDKCFDTKFGRFALQLENTLAKHCKEWIKQARDKYIMDAIDEERAVTKVWLSKIDENYEAYRKADEEKMDSALARFKSQFNALAKEHSKLKSLFESTGKEPVQGLVFESPGYEQAKRPYEVISMKRMHFDRLIDNECKPHHVMRFKVHKIDELYPDLQQYGDIREEISEFVITDEAALDFYTFNNHTLGHGCYGSAELYYLSPGSKPPAGLVRVDGSKDFKELVNAHSEKMTRVCHLYLVGGGDFLDADDPVYTYDDRFEGMQDVDAGEAGLVYSDSASPARPGAETSEEGDDSK